MGTSPSYGTSHERDLAEEREVRRVPSAESSGCRPLHVCAKVTGSFCTAYTNAMSTACNHTVLRATQAIRPHADTFSSRRRVAIECTYRVPC